MSLTDDAVREIQARADDYRYDIMPTIRADVGALTAALLESRAALADARREIERLKDEFNVR